MNYTKNLNVEVFISTTNEIDNQTKRKLDAAIETALKDTVRLADNYLTKELSATDVPFFTFGMQKIDEHYNPEYEYTTRHYPTFRASKCDKNVSAGKQDATLEKDGWRRLWASQTAGGTFVVYQRDRHTTFSPFTPTAA